MNKFEVKTNTHIVIKRTDIRKYLRDGEAVDLVDAVAKINIGRNINGNKTNSYYICNTDEPYAQQVFETIKEGELEKEDALFDKDSRFCKVCGCSQERACPSGCYWVTDDLCSNCVYSIYTCEAIVTPKGAYSPIDGTDDYLADEITSEDIADGFIAGHAAALKLSSEAEEIAVNSGDRVRVYAVYQHGEILKEIVYSLEPQKE
ncbi:MAG: hypothetical protein ABII85_01750 [Bacillota bacterium]